MLKKTLILISSIVLFAGILTACTPRQATEDLSDEITEDTSVVELSAWTIDSDCESCHEAETASGSDSSCTYSIHAAEGVVCQTCHTDTDGKLSQAHEDYATAEQPKRLKDTEMTDEICLSSCHDVEELKSLTAASTVLIDANGTVVNPHDLPSVEDHTNSITCSDCHKMHKSTEITAQAQSTCTSCHHAGVFECGTCH